MCGLTSGSCRISALDGTSAVVSPELGGTVASLCFPTENGPREVLFCHAHFGDSSSTATRGGIPLLFPNCGRLFENRYVVNGRAATLPIHGFAMRRAWRIKNQSADTLELTLNQPASGDYPFDVLLTLYFEVRSSGFLLCFSVRNPSAASVPFSAGWHPYFLTPSDPAGKAAMQIHVPACASARYDASYTAISKWEAPLPDPLSPSHPLFKEALHRANSDAVSLVWPDGFRLDLKTGQSAAAFVPYWQLHTEADKPFVCVEPWTSPPNALNSGEGLIDLPPGDEWRMSLEISAVAS